MKCLKQLIFSQRIRAKESNHKIEMTLKRFFCPFWPILLCAKGS